MSVYNAFNPTTAQLTTNNRLSLYTVHPTVSALEWTTSGRSPMKEYTNNDRFFYICAYVESKNVVK